jgi:hypothetical protein
MDVCCVLSGGGLWTSWSLVQKSPTDCGASLCAIKKPRYRGGHSPRWAAEPEKIVTYPCVRWISFPYLIAVRCIVCKTKNIPCNYDSFMKWEAEENYGKWLVGYHVNWTGFEPRSYPSNVNIGGCYCYTKPHTTQKFNWREEGRVLKTEYKHQLQW